jgi:hypothetical protein
MSKPAYSERALTMRVSELLSKKQFAAARMLLRGELAASASLPKRRQKILLGNLISVESVAGRPLAALKALERRRSLGYRRQSERLDDYFHAATFLARSGQWEAARAELIRLFTSRGFLQSSGLLPPLELYFNVEEECRRCLGPILAKAYKTDIRKNGIPVSIASGKLTLEENVRAALASYHAAARKYEALLIRAFTDREKNGRAALLRDIQEYISAEKVDFFKGEARKLLSRAKPRQC